MNTPDRSPLDLDVNPPHQPTPHQRMALTFDAFHEYHHKLWLRYAQTQVGSRADADTVVAATCRQLLRDWAHVLEQESVPAYTWAVLREQIHRWLSERGRGPALVGTAAFDAACRKLLLYELRDEFAVLESEIGLYSAIAELPERQYDVIVLRYVLGCTDEEVAEYLGFRPATVRSHVRHAKRKLAARLNVRWRSGREE